MLKKLLITGGIGLTAYVINEVRKEYDKNVSDYNNLLDRYNELWIMSNLVRNFVPEKSHKSIMLR